MKNTIAERIYDFLKDFPPFNSLERNHLMTLCEQVKVGYYEKGSYIFKTNEELHNSFYVVKDGAIGIFRDAILVDKCDEGDIFGLRALIRKSNYQLSARAIEESITYAISSNLLEDLITSNTNANKFLLASFATNTLRPYSNTSNGRLYSQEGEFQDNNGDFIHLQSVKKLKPPVICREDTPVDSAAKIMTDNRVGSIIIADNKKPIGIITDKDLRTKIATGIFPIDAKVKQIMSSPVICIPENTSVAEAQIVMLRDRITHLCITKDGTSHTELVGVLSEHDIVVSSTNNPSFLIKEVKRAQSAEKLLGIRIQVQGLMERYLKQHIPIFFVSKIVAAINEAICQRAIAISLEEMKNPLPTSFAWLALGSQGRREQMLLTDQDNALVFEDVPSAQYKKTKAYFLKLASLITKKLNTVGFEYCPAEMMASNPKWCLSLSEWKQQFNNWITHPDEDKIMLSTIFFDYERSYGNRHLVDDMSDSIFKSIDSYGIFLNFLALNAIKNPPPLSFFRQFLVEDDGEHKDRFDIKARAMMPLVDAARLLVISYNIKGHNNTILRFEKLIEEEPQNRDLYAACIDAFKILLRFRTLQGIKHNDSGRFIDLKSLNKSDRLKLKGCFGPIRDIQELIKVRFNLSQMM
ncbi:MAG: CBS domain-containing protein [Maribacter sp.]|nr:CBS domain-containing protein [Maribacter sp.]